MQDLAGTVQQIIAGAHHTLVLTSQGLYACGYNRYGQLGLGDTNDRNTTFTRVQAPPGTLQQITAGYAHTLVLTNQGLYVCGHNEYGQLGMDDTNNRTVFTQVSGLPGELQQAMAGDTHTLVLTSQGLYVCGHNGYGQLGLGDRNDRPTFTQVKDLPGSLQQLIAGGSNHTLVLTSQGLYTCGHNEYGQLGIGDTNNRAAFTAIACLPSELKQRLALYQQIQTLIVLDKSNACDPQQNLTSQRYV